MRKEQLRLVHASTYLLCFSRVTLATTLPAILPLTLLPQPPMVVMATAAVGAVMEMVVVREEEGSP